MLPELLQHALTPTRHPAARRMGYLYEAIALSARYRRCRSRWDPHYARCREVIEAALPESGRRALILGAGTLRDVPLDRLSARFERVDLVDLVWLWPAHWRTRRHANVQLVEHDVTEALTSLMAGEMTVPQPRWGLDGGYDLVVSLNLATQLPLLPAQWLLKRKTEDRIIDAYGRALMQAHLDWLRAFPGAAVCLIADRLIETRAPGRPVEPLDPWWGVTPPPEEAHWWWEAVPRREGRGEARWHRVGVSRWRNPARDSCLRRR